MIIDTDIFIILLILSFIGLCYSSNKIVNMFKVSKLDARTHREWLLFDLAWCEAELEYFDKVTLKDK
jgi:hypothetical protein|tara:strand:- start:4011 stop:4211 length:201 start_codon:yes stop_codon:yes gene_type:complete